MNLYRELFLSWWIMLLYCTLDGIQHINVPKSQISYTVSSTVVAQLLCKDGVHDSDECPVHLLATCAHALSKRQDMSTWKYFLWNYLKVHIMRAVNMHISDYRHAVHSRPFFKQGWSEMSPLFGQISSKTAPMQGVQNYWLPSPLLVSMSPECRSNANQYDLCSFEELFNVCF